jgi:hypothetical protein
MQTFIDKTIKPVLIIGGIGTALANLDAFFPRFAVENVQKLEFVPEYTIFVQHWGIMVGLMGIFMVVAAFRESWRVPILLYSLIEKAFMVFLVVSNAHLSFAEGFYVPAAMDAFIVLYSILYFWSLREAQQTHATPHRAHR